MYKFSIIVLLRNGKEISGVYETDGKTSGDAAVELIGRNLNENKTRFNVIMSEDGSEQVIFRAEDISAIKISAYKPK